jgi:hypothetical protein
MNDDHTLIAIGILVWGLLAGSTALVGMAFGSIAATVFAFGIAALVIWIVSA